MVGMKKITTCKNLQLTHIGFSHTITFKLRTMGEVCPKMLVIEENNRP